MVCLPHKSKDKVRFAITPPRSSRWADAWKNVYHLSKWKGSEGICPHPHRGIVLEDMALSPRHHLAPVSMLGWGHILRSGPSSAPEAHPLHMGLRVFSDFLHGPSSLCLHTSKRQGAHPIQCKIRCSLPSLRELPNDSMGCS